MVTKIVGFILVSALYWLLALVIFGGLAFLLTHNPDDPRSSPPFELIVTAAILVVIYGAICWSFARRLRSARKPGE